MQNLRNTSEPPFDLGHFIRDRFASLCAVAASLTGDSEAAKDIAQEVIIKFWENRAQYDKLESVENYLFIMVRNEALNYMRSLVREKSAMRSWSAWRRRTILCGTTSWSRRRISS